MKKLKKLTFKHIDVVEMGIIKGGANDCTTYPKRDDCSPKPDVVWCLQGDSCGEYDKWCGWPLPGSHDGCCTGAWDHKGDGASVYY